MIRKYPNQNQRNLFSPLLSDFIDMSHELILLSQKIDWKQFEEGFSEFYSHTGQPSMPIRFMVGCLLLKRLYNLGDETLAKERVMNPYMLYFCGEAHFKHSFPCDPRGFVHFRHRIRKEGVELIFKHSIELHGPKVKSKQTLSDTTVQENNVTYPTDAKPAKKIIDSCARIAREEKMKQRQSYKRISKQLVRDTYNSNHPKRKKKARKAARKLKTIGGRVVRELLAKLPDKTLEQYRDQLELYLRTLNQQRTDKDKIYSLHKPYTACIAKGKAHKKYEYGNKTGFMLNLKSLVVFAVALMVILMTVKPSSLCWSKWNRIWITCRRKQCMTEVVEAALK
ncbi:MAG: transposase [Carboxylicivirga sp.]|jgi:IS5 family transposase|nr:transposase [Carboxylicivirga sp.]